MKKRREESSITIRMALRYADFLIISLCISLFYAGVCNASATVYTFDKVDGGIISSVPESPKGLNVIIFGRPECLNTRYTMSRICNNDWGLNDRINFIYADVDGNDSATVSSLKSEYPGIVFCYGNNNSKAWKYYSEFGLQGGSVTLPFVVYIDSNGNLRNVTTGPQNEEEIYTNVCNYLGVEKKNHYFTAMVYGKVNLNNGRSQLNMLNSFRKSGDAWYWNSDDTTKHYCNGLNDLVYDYGLEKLAIQRAKELAFEYSHSRPNGLPSTIEGNTTWGENIAVGYTDVQYVFNGWREDDDGYDGQGHRRNMLYEGYTTFAAACFESDGIKYWVQEFGNRGDVNTNNNAGSYSEAEKMHDISISDRLYKIKEFDSIPSIDLETGKSIKGSYMLKYTSDDWFSAPLYFDTRVSSEDSSIAEVSADRTITGRKTGKTNIVLKAMISGTEERVVRVPITVFKPISGAEVTLDKTSFTYNGKPCKPGVKVVLGGKILKNGTDYTVSYLNNTNAGEAECTITGAGAYKGTLSKIFNINRVSIKDAKVELTKAAIDKSQWLRLYPQSVTLNGVVLKAYEDYYVSNRRSTWRDNELISVTLFITGTGNYTGTASGTFSKGAQKEKKEVKIQSISINPGSREMDYGKPLTLKPRISPSNANEKLTWSSSNQSVAVVSQKGVVTAQKAGTATITVKSESGKTAYCKITVKAVKVKSVKITKVKSIAKDQVIKLKATVSPSNAADKTLTWSLAKGNKGHAKLNSKTGELTCIGAGDIKVEVKTVNGKKATLTIKGPKEVTGVKIKPAPKKIKVTKLKVGDKFKFNTTISPNSAIDKTVKWKSSNESVATVDQKGNVTCLKKGTATISATSVSNPKKSGKSKLTVR